MILLLPLLTLIGFDHIFHEVPTDTNPDAPDTIERFASGRPRRSCGVSTLTLFEFCVDQWRTVDHDRDDLEQTF